MKIWTMLVVLVWTFFGVSAVGAEMIHKWKSPSFSGIGTSAHFLTIENQEFTRKAEIKAKKESEEAKKIAAAKNTNYAKFIDNLESRIYAEFSKQLTDNLFGESCGTTYTTATVDGVTTTTQNTLNPEIGNTDGVGSNCTGTYSFNNTTVTYTKDVTNDIVTLDIAGPDGSQVITLPLNDFQF
tara:strand:+ start:124 stop:672 length:549 start_codon:yes stop_codon:yes gene_type:complete